MVIVKTYCDKCGIEIEGGTDITNFHGKDLCQECVDKAVAMIKAWIEEGKAEEEPKPVSVQKKPKSVQEFENTVVEKVKTAVNDEKTEQQAEEPKAEKTKPGRPKKEKTDEQQAELEEQQTDSGERRRIDWGKACALKVSGWKNAAIADELGISEAYVNSKLYMYLSDYKKARGLK